MNAGASRDELLAELGAFPARLESAARSAAGRPRPAGEWSVEQVVRHLIAVEREVHQARLRDLATIADPRWSWTEPGPWAGQPELGLDQVLGLFSQARDSTVRTLEALDEAGWARTGTHATFGVLDVGGVMRTAADHDQDHLAGLHEGPSTGP
jgi:hypothetical protein